ncbi:MAG: hypothetical protein WAM14_10785 [Candidatus Nitrosopolaris sp.]
MANCLTNELGIPISADRSVCADRFYDHIEKIKDAVSEYLYTRFGRWHDDIMMTLDL